MEIKFSDSQKGIIEQIEANGVKVPFYPDLGPSFYKVCADEREAVELAREGNEYRGKAWGCEFSLSYETCGENLKITAKIKNASNLDFAPDAVGLKLGINSYMTVYPDWCDKFFPSYLRCEKTHFVGYFMSPEQKIVAVACKEPIAAWELDYNTFTDEENCHFGHRIYTGNLLFAVNDNLPERHPDIRTIGVGDSIEREIFISALGSVSEFEPWLNSLGIPTVEFDRYTLAKGETAELTVKGSASYSLEIMSPTGEITKERRFVAEENGVYTATVTTEDGYKLEAKLYCRHDFGWYLKAARKNAVYKPQKASTHTESWYGHFSSFLAAKHYPDDALDGLARANFDEIMPYMYNFKTGEAIVIPWRIQNVALLVSLLVDLYEADPESNSVYLDYADNMAELLLKGQTEDGAYRNRGTHYTSVIYIAKSILELALCEQKLAKSEEKYRIRFEKHYASAKRAVDDLCKLRECIGTEGEHTLEDGMITCSALQLGFFALTLPEEERTPYIESAEYLMSVHKCLEELVTPDARTRGATLRFWEAQYDVMIRGNMMNTPHGWTSWKNYATYYLYLLTGKEQYLKDTFDTMGACLQMVDEDENLRWAFIKDPWRRVKVLVPDKAAPVKESYRSDPDGIEPAYRGKHIMATVGECYVDMISGWYRVAEEKMTGGYQICPLYIGDGETEVDNQGGACDNDVHEHFKCLEETLLKKAFVIVEKGVARGYNCKASLRGDALDVVPLGECDAVHINTDSPIVLNVASRTLHADVGMKFYKL